MKSGKNKTLKLIGATAVTLFSLVTVFAATMAWFAMNDNTNGNGLSVSVARGSDIKLLSCYAVRYDGNYGAIATDISSGNEVITMSEYDYIFTDRNVNTPLFLRMEIANFASTDDLSVTIPCRGAYKNDDKVEPYLSNVVSAKFLRGLKVNGNVVVDNYTWTGNNVTTAAVVASYKGMLANAADSVGTPFVSNGTKQNLISLTLPASVVFDEDFIVTRKDENNNDIDVAIVYVELDYHVTGTVNLVTEYLNSYNGSEHSLSFASDIEVVELINEAND